MLMFWWISVHIFEFSINRIQTASALGCPFCLNFEFPISLDPWWIPFSLSEGAAKAMLRCFLLTFSLPKRGMSQAGLALVKQELLLGSSRQKLWPCWSLQAGDGSHTDTHSGYVSSLHIREIHKQHSTFKPLIFKIYSWHWNYAFYYFINCFDKPVVSEILCGIKLNKNFKKEEWKRISRHLYWK